MPTPSRFLLLVLAIGAQALPALLAPVAAQTASPAWPVDLETVAKIRAEGFMRSKLPNTLSYLTDVLGARLTNSDDMRRAQGWALGHMREIGLENVAAEPFMNYGTSWDNEYVSVHMMEPDYSPLVAYPIAYTPSTKGRERLQVVIANAETRQDLELYRGKLQGKAVLSSNPPVIDRTRFATGSPRRTDEEMEELTEAVITPSPAGGVFVPAQRRVRNPDLISATERLAFYQSEGVAVVLESRGGWPGAVQGYARPGATADRWSGDVTQGSIPIIAITPQHYNRMYRVAARQIPVEIEVEVRNRHGDGPSQASNLIGEIKGSDLADEVVMLGAHFDTWHASPNASDNTSGVAVMLEAIRILKVIGIQPRRTIRIALWSGEEQGLWGSRAYVRKHFGDPRDASIGTTDEYDKLSVYFNQDYGPGLYRGIWLQGNEHVRTAFTSWMEPLRDLGMTTVSPRSVGSTDHIAFDEVGLSAFQFLQARVGGTGGHTNLDFYDTLPIDELQTNAVIMAAFVYHAAMADQALPRKQR